MIKTRSCWKFGGPAEREEPRLFNFVYDRSGPWFRLYAPTGSAPVLFYPESPWTWSGAGASRTRKRTGMRTPSTCPAYKPRSAVIVNRRRPLSSGCHKTGTVRRLMHDARFLLFTSLALLPAFSKLQFAGITGRGFSGKSWPYYRDEEEIKRFEGDWVSPYRDWTSQIIL